MSADPATVHELRGDANPYAYVSGRTLIWTDPDGRLVPILAAVVIGAAIGGAISGGVYAATAGSSFSMLGLGAAVGVGALAGAASGGTGAALTGALAGSLGATAATVVAAGAAGAVGGGVGYSAGALAYGYSMSWGGFGMAAGLGAASGVAFGGADIATGGAISKAISKPFSFLMDDAATGASGATAAKPGGATPGSGARAGTIDDFMPQDPAALFEPPPAQPKAAAQPTPPGPGGGGADPRMQRIINAQDAHALKNPSASCATVGCDAARGTALEVAKQGKHIPGHKNFIPNRSPLTHKDPAGLLQRFAGKGEAVGNVPRGQPGFKERVDFREVIGEVGGKPTTKGIIHYSKGGAHIVPANP